MNTSEHGAVILVADGDERVLQQISPTLEKAGFTVLTALGRSATLQFCRGRREAVDLVIIDLEMGTGGQGLVPQLCGSHPDVRVLFTATEDQFDTIEQASQSSHFGAFLKKPFRRSRLLGSVLKALDAPLRRTA